MSLRPWRALLTAETSGGSRDGAFRMGPSIWSTSGVSRGSSFALAEGFLRAATDPYGARHRTLDFRTPGASRAINDWANAQTRGLIRALLDDRLLAPLEWVLLNTALFEGNWGLPMRRVGAAVAYRCVSIDGTGQADIRAWLADEAVPGLAWMAQRLLGGEGTLHQLSIQLPAFAFSDAITQRRDTPVTQDLTLAPLFDAGADLSRLSTRPSRVGILRQATRIELDEKGVRAAAATLIGGIRATTARPGHPRRKIMVNRPFTFAIIERASQALLFEGVLLSPLP